MSVFVMYVTQRIYGERGMVGLFGIALNVVEISRKTVASRKYTEPCIAEVEKTPNGVWNMP